jgi:hypothetical protein
MTSQAQQHHLSDWLELHELTPETCRVLMDAMSDLEVPEPGIGDQGEPGKSTIDLDAAWLTAVDAMRASFPAHASMIDLTFEKTKRVQLSRRHGSRKAATIDNGPAADPVILYSYMGETADLLVLAHEFAHALQIRASGGRFVLPVMREVCAFLGEYALLKHVSSSDMALYRRLRQVWDADHKKYLGAGKNRLISALSRPEAVYRYSWNYPIARYLSIKVQERLVPNRVWALFEGRLSIPALLQELDLAFA